MSLCVTLPTIFALPAFKDNYIWIIRYQNKVAVVDPGDSRPVVEYLKEAPPATISDILITHHHHDHTGGVDALKTRFPEAVLHQKAAPPRMLFETFTLQSIAVPGHTLDHIAFILNYAQQTHLFCGDTLFSAGCGRLFEGTPAMMFESLQKISALPEDTLVYCAHEYTLTNLAFALEIEPENYALKSYQEACQVKRQTNQSTLPTTLLREKNINPFLRTDTPSIRNYFNLPESAEHLTVFKELREKRNHF